MMTDRQRLPDPIAAARALPKGAAVLLRDYNATDRREIGDSLARVCREVGLSLIVAGDIELARQLDAAGLHLPEWQIAQSSKNIRSWKSSGRGRFVSAAAHSHLALIQAEQAGADIALLSPVFQTASHPESPGVGPLRFVRLCRRSNLPVYALGGIDERNIRRLRGSHAAGIAGIGVFSTAGKPG